MHRYYRICIVRYKGNPVIIRDKNLMSGRNRICQQKPNIGIWKKLLTYLIITLHRNILQGPVFISAQTQKHLKTYLFQSELQRFGFTSLLRCLSSKRKAITGSQCYQTYHMCPESGCAIRYGTVDARACFTRGPDMFLSSVSSMICTSTTRP